MRVVIFRSELRDAEDADVTAPLVFSFSPIPPDEGRGLFGSGPAPWKTVTVPYGSRVTSDSRTGEAALYLPGQEKALSPAEVAERWGSGRRPPGDTQVRPRVLVWTSGE